MRSPKSRSRSKNRGGNRSPANNINRVFDSSGPEGKVRGTPQQIIDKYAQLSRDAVLAGDRVAGENFQQHAEHYTRMLAEAQRDAEEKRQQADQQNRERQQQRQRDRDDQRSRETPAPQKNPDQPAGDEAKDATEVVDLGGQTDDSGLVETPESQPKKRSSRSRKPRAKAETETAGDGNAEAPEADADAPEAPEAAAG